MAADHWPAMCLGDLINIKHGWPFKSHFFSEELSGRPIVVSIGNFSYTGGFRFNETTLKEYRAEFSSEYILSPGDILLVMTCQTAGGEILGLPGRVPDDGHIYLHNQRMGKVQIKAGFDVESGFLYYLFLTPQFNRHLVTTASGTKILHTAPGRIESFRFRCPPLPEQRAIAHILGTLDDKIELNRRMNETLESIARALFRSWFVDFDPVRAKAEGRQPAGMDAATAALFPDRFEESELGEIPAGWSVGTIADLASLSRQGINPVDFPQEVFYHYSLPAFDEGRVPKLELSQLIKSNKLIVPKDGVLLSKLNPHISRVWLPKVKSTHRSVCSTEFLVVLPKLPFARTYVFGLLSSSSFLSQFRSLVTGTTGSHQRVRPEMLLDMMTVLPHTSAIDHFSTLVQPLYDQMGNKLDENSALVAIRDVLLPKLLSGEVRVSEAERLLQESI